MSRHENRRKALAQHMIAYSLYAYKSATVSKRVKMMSRWLEYSSLASRRHLAFNDVNEALS
jgi:hypothetical protein